MTSNFKELSQYFGTLINISSRIPPSIKLSHTFQEICWKQPTFYCVCIENSKTQFQGTVGTVNNHKDTQIPFRYGFFTVEHHLQCTDTVKKLPLLHCLFCIVVSIDSFISILLYILLHKWVCLFVRRLWMKMQRIHLCVKKASFLFSCCWNNILYIQRQRIINSRNYCMRNFSLTLYFIKKYIFTNNYKQLVDHNLN